MSTLNAASLRASTDVQTPSLKDASGLNPSTALQIQQGRAKAWFNLDGTGTIAGRDSFNVSSFTDNGVGDYTTSYASGMPSANYAPQGGVSAGTETPVSTVRGLIFSIISAGSIRSVAVIQANTATDFAYVLASMDGD